jgi:hypothetical protein
VNAFRFALSIQRDLAVLPETSLAEVSEDHRYAIHSIVLCCRHQASRNAATILNGRSGEQRRRVEGFGQ